MRFFLLSDKFPFLLTLLFGLVAYFFSNIVEFEMDTPIITYSISEPNDTMGKAFLFKPQIKEIDSIYPKVHLIKKQLCYTFENISRATVFRDISLTFAYRTEGKTTPPYRLYDPEIVNSSPGVYDTNPKKYHYTGDQFLVYNIPSFQPGNKYVLRFYSISNDSVNEYPKIYINSKETVRIEERSFFDCLIKNRLCIYTGLLVSCIGLIILYFYLMYKFAKR